MGLQVSYRVYAEVPTPSSVPGTQAASRRCVSITRGAARVIDEPFILTLDDYHLITETLVRDLVDEVLERPPRSLHLVILSRFNPPLLLVSLRARAMMTDIRMQELQFTTQETVTFLQHVLGDTPKDAVLAHLHARTEGWPVSLRLASLALQYGLTSEQLLTAVQGDAQQIQAYMLSAYFESTHNSRFLLEVLLLHAWSHKAHGDVPSATATLRRAIGLAQPGGFIRLFADMGPELTKMLDGLDLDSKITHFVDRIRMACGHELPYRSALDAPSPTSPDSCSLTPRELDVLELLGQRLSDKEIAATLFISPKTVKRHTNNIYSKLHVNDRREAVSQAQALGLISL